MKTSKAGAERISKHEWVPKSKRCGWDPVKQLYLPYKDYKGFLTLGCGHLVKPGENFSAGVTEERVAQIFAADLTPLEEAIAEHVKVPLTQNQFDALISFGFNCGKGALSPKTNTAIRMLNLGKYELVPKFLEPWNKSDGVFDANLLNRRKAEGALFATPDPEPQHEVGVLQPSPAPIPEPEPEPVADVPVVVIKPWWRKLLELLGVK